MAPGEERRLRREFVATCEQDGADATRGKLDGGAFSGRHRVWAADWLTSQDERARLAAIAADREVDRGIARENNRIAEESNRIARRANRIAVAAAVLAALALAVAIYAAMRQFPVSPH